MWVGWWVGGWVGDLVSTSSSDATANQPRPALFIWACRREKTSLHPLLSTIPPTHPPTHPPTTSLTHQCPKSLGACSALRGRPTWQCAQPLPGAWCWWWRGGAVAHRAAASASWGTAGAGAAARWFGRAALGVWLLHLGERGGRSALSGRCGVCGRRGESMGMHEGSRRGVWLVWPCVGTRARACVVGVGVGVGCGGGVYSGFALKRRRGVSSQPGGPSSLLCVFISGGKARQASRCLLCVHS